MSLLAFLDIVLLPKCKIKGDCKGVRVVFSHDPGNNKNPIFETGHEMYHYGIKGICFLKSIFELRLVYCHEFLTPSDFQETLSPTPS